MLLLRVLAAVSAAFLLPATALATTHLNKEVSVLHSPDTRECSFFQLVGVGEADPVTPANAWFAVSKAHIGYKEIVATLLMARATGKPLNHVATNGAVACGHAAVSSLSL